MKSEFTCFSPSDAASVVPGGTRDGTAAPSSHLPVELVARIRVGPVAEIVLKRAVAYRRKLQLRL